MRESRKVPFTQWAAIHKTEKFTAIEAVSGYRRTLHEDEGYRIYSGPNTSAEELGSALLEALGRSRFVDPHKEPGFFDADRITKSDELWHKDFMDRYGYKTKRDAYRNMLYCLVERRSGLISIRPHRRDSRPEYFWKLPPDRTVVLPETNDVEELGAAVQLALSRCE